MGMLGCFESNLEGVSTLSVSGQSVPSMLDLREELNDPWDQGDKSICVSICMTDTLKYLYNFQNKKYKKALDFFYKERKDKTKEGMTIREALEIAVQEQLMSSFAFIRNTVTLMHSIFSNGPAIVALPVYSTDRVQFWLPDNSSSVPIGHHAVTFVGYMPEFFILRNSWGTDYYEGGYSYFSFDSFKYIREAWTIFK